MRKSGILMHLSSLPGDYGIGTMGKEAFEFIDFLVETKQTYWQMLPVCPTSFGDSPYQSFSTYAGNPYFINLDLLCSQGFLSEEDLAQIPKYKNQTKIDYGKLYEERNLIFKKIYSHFIKNIPADYENFCNENSWWLNDFSLFMAIKEKFNGVAFIEWPENFKNHDDKTLENFSKENSNLIEHFKMLQYLFFNQWNKLKKYANENGIKIIGDLPIYVAADSSDVWSNPHLFQLDENCTPINIAGCPPDSFAKTGQLWGNPVYKWENHQKDNYSWWKLRIKKSLEIYDVIRIDHFRGFESYYAIPFGSKTAENGIWEKGPGSKLFESLKNDLGQLPVLAEDLGYLTDEVRKMLKESGFPGMKILQFAFDSREKSSYLPYEYNSNCVVYTGTHDNDTIHGWIKSAPKEDVHRARKFLEAKNSHQLCSNMMKVALACNAETAILTMQDILHLGTEARMNTPSTLGCNWKWRMNKKQLKKKHKKFLKYYTELFGRI